MKVETKLIAPMDTLHFVNIHHTQDQEEEEETLSLSDLPLYSNDWDQDLSSQESTSFSSSSEDDFFEFFSQEYFNPSPPAGIPPENIIFCGKLIPYKQPYCDAKSSFESRKQEAHTKKDDQDCGVSRWNFGSSNSTSERCINSKNDKTREIPLAGLVQKKVKDRHVSSPLRYSPKKVKGCNFPAHKFPVMASSSSGKAKWYLFFFGMSRLSSAMEINGINSRRSRRQYPPPVFSFRSGRDKNISDDRDRVWRMGGLLGALSCGGHRHADTMVAASIRRPALK